MKVCIGPCRPAWKPVRERVGMNMLDATQALRDRVREWLTEASEHSEMSLADRAYLEELYCEPNRRLEEWLKADLSHWT